MRHDAWRREADAYPLRGELQPRFTDVDVWQHLNNTALISMHGEAVQQALSGLFGPQAWRGGQPALASVSFVTDFLAEAYYPTPLAWGARVLDGGGDGLRIATALFQESNCVGLGTAVIGCWEDTAAVALDEARLATMRAHRVPDPGVSAPAFAAHPDTDEEAFPWRTEVRTRFGDSDARRLASDTFLARCAEQMRVQFLEELFSNRRETLGGMLVAHVGLRWLRRGTPGPTWRIGCGVAHVGDRSLAVRGAMFDGGRCVAVSESVMVAIDPQSRRSASLSPAARSALDPWRMPRTA